MTDIQVAKNGFFVRPLVQGEPQQFAAYENPLGFGLINRQLAGTIDANGIDHATLTLEPLPGVPPNPNFIGTQDIAFTWEFQSTYNGTNFQDPGNINGAPIIGTPEGDAAYVYCNQSSGSDNSLFNSSLHGGSSSGNLPQHQDLVLLDLSSRSLFQGIIDPKLRLFSQVGIAYFARFTRSVTAHDPQTATTYFGGYLVQIYLKLISRQLNESGRVYGLLKSFYFGAINKVVKYETTYTKDYDLDILEESTGTLEPTQDSNPPTKVDNSTYGQTNTSGLPINELGAAISYNTPGTDSTDFQDIGFVARDNSKFGTPNQSIISVDSTSETTVLGPDATIIRDLNLNPSAEKTYDRRDLNNYSSFNSSQLILGKNSLQEANNVIVQTWAADKVFDLQPDIKTIKFHSIPDIEGFDLQNLNNGLAENSVSFLSFDVGSKQSILLPQSEDEPDTGYGS